MPPVINLYEPCTPFATEALECHAGVDVEADDAANASLEPAEETQSPCSVAGDTYLCVDESQPEREACDPQLVSPPPAFLKDLLFSRPAQMKMRLLLLVDHILHVVPELAELPLGALLKMATRLKNDLEHPFLAQSMITGGAFNENSRQYVALFGQHFGRYFQFEQRNPDLARTVNNSIFRRLFPTWKISLALRRLKCECAILSFLLSPEGERYRSDDAAFNMIVEGVMEKDKEEWDALPSIPDDPDFDTDLHDLLHPIPDGYAEGARAFIEGKRVVPADKPRMLAGFRYLESKKRERLSESDGPKEKPLPQVTLDDILALLLAVLVIDDELCSRAEGRKLNLEDRDELLNRSARSLMAVLQGAKRDRTLSRYVDQDGEFTEAFKALAQKVLKRGPLLNE